MNTKKHSRFILQLWLVFISSLLFSGTAFADNHEQNSGGQPTWRWVLVGSAVPTVSPNTDKRFQLSKTLNIQLGQRNGMHYRLNYLDVEYDWGKMPATINGGSVYSHTVKQKVNDPESQRLQHRFTMYRGPSGMSSGGTTAGTRTATADWGGSTIPQLGAANGSGSALMKVEVPRGLRSGDRMSIYFNSGVGIGMLNVTAEYVYEWRQSEGIVESEQPASPAMGQWQKWVLVESRAPTVSPNTDKRFQLSKTLNIQLGQRNGMHYRLNYLDVEYDWGKMPASINGGSVYSHTVKQKVNDPESQRLHHRFTMYRGPSGMSSGGTTAGTRTATAYWGDSALQQLGAANGSGSAVMKVDVPRGVRAGDRMSIYFNSGVGIGMLNVTAEYVYEWK